jgi:hypothetical protein
MTEQKSNPDNDRDLNELTRTSSKPKRMSWLLYFGIAFLIAIWTALGALFFLAIVWVLRRNPGSDTSYTLAINDKKTAQRVYTWLFFSSFITVPIFIGAAANAAYNSTINERVLAALIPLIMHAPLLLGLTSKSGFVYRHTQQGILFIAVRAGMASLAAINVEDNIEYALLLFVFGNGALWLLSSIVGWSQTSNGKCWFMERKGEKILLPESIKPEKPNTSINDEELDELLKSLDATGMTTARQKAMHAFQTGTPELKKRAIAVLAKLGEVEKF